MFAAFLCCPNSEAPILTGSGLSSYPEVDLTLLTASEAADRFGISPKTVGMWASRGWENEEGKQVKLTPIDYKGRYNAARYDWTELVVAEQQTRSKRNRSHRKPIPGLVLA